MWDCASDHFVTIYWRYGPRGKETVDLPSSEPAATGALISSPTTRIIHQVIERTQRVPLVRPRARSAIDTATCANGPVVSYCERFHLMPPP
jgi:hypothetical protein